MIDSHEHDIESRSFYARKSKILCQGSAKQEAFALDYLWLADHRSAHVRNELRSRISY